MAQQKGPSPQAFDRVEEGVPLTDVQRRQAALTVAARADGRDDCVRLLSVLGLDVPGGGVDLPVREL